MMRGRPFGSRGEYSKAPAALRAVWGRARAALWALGAVGGVLLVVADFLSLLTVTTDTGQVVGGVTGGEHHGYALLVLGLGALVLAAAAAVVRGRGPARLVALTTALVGIIALIVVLTVDVPDINASGIVDHPLRQGFARPAAGFYLETLGALLVLVSGGGRLLAGDEEARRQVAAGRDRAAAEN